MLCSPRPPKSSSPRDESFTPRRCSRQRPRPRSASSSFSPPQINNGHTRKAYLNATRRFAEWCDAHSSRQLADVQPFHVAAFVKDLQGEFSPPTVKQSLAALRMLFDWLVAGHILDVNPAHAAALAQWRQLGAA